MFGKINHANGAKRNLELLFFFFIVGNVKTSDEID